MSEDRLTELEIRYTLQQDLVHQLSDVVARHEREIEKLKRELSELRDRPRADSRPLEPDDPPPHY